MIISSSSNGVSTVADADDACGERNGFILEFIVASYRQIHSNHIIKLPPTTTTHYSI
jgi:hypothetical protein